MTECAFPDFVGALFAKELQRLVGAVLEDVAEHYNIPADELKERYLSGGVDVISSKLSKVEVTVKKGRKDVPVAYRCMARTWNQGRGGRCKWAKVADSEFCRNHDKKHKAGTLKHGVVSEPINSEVFPARVKKEVVYK